MNYNDALSYIRALKGRGIKPGLSRIKALLFALCNPQDKVKAVHVAGTNGKGSICHICASVLCEAGYKTGLFTSPFVECFEEQIKIDGRQIDKDTLAALTDRVRREAEKIGDVTEFEFTVALAFLYFAEEKCDYAVIEAGLGGLEDATNVIAEPAAAVIAAVSYDHTAILGDTLEKIAIQKCGIIKENCKAVIYPIQENEVFAVAKSVRGDIVIPDLSALEITKKEVGALQYTYRGISVKSSLWGSHQVYNGITAIEAMLALGIDADAIKKGIEKTKLSGRLELINGKRTCLLDAGHNPQAVDACAEALVCYKATHGGRIITVMGMCADKNYGYCIPEIAALSNIFIGVTADTPRALSGALVAKEAKSRLSADTVEAGVLLALSIAKDDDLVLICGSFYTVSPARAYLTEVI